MPRTRAPAAHWALVSRCRRTSNPRHPRLGDLPMAWREAILGQFGPGLLGGNTLGDWLKLLRENRFAVAPSRIPRAVAITMHAAQNSLFRLTDDLRTGRGLEEVAV